MIAKVELKRQFPAKLDHLYEMMRFILDFIGSFSFSLSSYSKVELAIEEALVNIITHAYCETSDGTITIYLEPRDDASVAIILEDFGIEFNPFDKIKELGAPPITPTHGGYGIFFILELMDNVLYEREGNKNRLTLIKFP